jgi:hypothetical protein
MGLILKPPAAQFNKLLGGDETFKVSDGWFWGLKVPHGMCQNSAQEAHLHLVTVQRQQDGPAPYYWLLPYKSLDL